MALSVIKKCVYKLRISQKHGDPIETNIDTQEGLIETIKVKTLDNKINRCLRFCVFLSLLSNLLFTIVIALYLGGILTYNSYSNEHSLLLPCTEETNQYCNQITASSLVNLIQIISIANHTRDSIDDLYKKPNLSGKHKPRPAANLFLDVTEKRNKLRWISSQGYGTAFTMKDVRYDDGNLNVPVNGRYLVYNSLSIKSQNNFVKEQLIHTVFVENGESRGRNKTLLQNRIARVRGELTYQMSDLLSVVELKAGDTLYTTISNASAVYEESFTSVFGVFWLEKGISK